MLTTPAEAIKKIQEWYKTDMNQPIMLLVDDVDNLSEMLQNDNRYAGIYPSKDDIPKEIIDKCFDGITDDDRVWEAIRDSYAFDIDQQLLKTNEADEVEITENKLWAE